MAIFLVSLEDNRSVDRAIDLLQIFGVYREDIFLCPDGIPDESDRDLAYGQVFVFPGVRTKPEDWPNATEVIFLKESTIVAKPDLMKILHLAGFSKTTAPEDPYQVVSNDLDQRFKALASESTSLG